MLYPVKIIFVNFEIKLNIYFVEIINIGNLT